MHAKGHLRQAFLATLDKHRIDLPTVALESVVDGFHNGRNLTWGRLLGLLWDSTDTMPSGYCVALDVELGSSFARVARKLKADALRSHGSRVRSRPTL